MILHQLSASPFSSKVLTQCLARAVSTDKIILTQNAVYACQHLDSYKALTSFAPIYCLADDLAARGITVNNDIFIAIGYAEFVELTLNCKQIISW